MKYFIGILVFLTITLHYCNNQQTSSTSSQAERMRSESGAYSRTQYPHIEVKILDGDTFVYNKEHIRLASINAPEIAHSGKPADCGGYRAMSRLEHYLTRIRPVSMLRIERLGQDKYGRTLATVYIDNEPTSVNQHMVRDGYAQAYNPGFGITVPDYSADYTQAINQQAGVLDICSLANKSN